jgi:DNA topoisomerase-1
MAGRYGPYVTDGTTNATLPRDKQPETLTEQEAITLIDERAAKGPAKGKKKAPAKKAAPKKDAAAKKEPAAKKAPAKKAAAPKKKPRQEGRGLTLILPARRGGGRPQA